MASATSQNVGGSELTSAPQPEAQSSAQARDPIIEPDPPDIELGRDNKHRSSRPRKHLLAFVGLHNSVVLTHQQKLLRIHKRIFNSMPVDVSTSGGIVQQRVEKELSDTELKEVQEALHQYCEAVEDFERMLQHKSKPEVPPYIARLWERWDKSKKNPEIEKGIVEIRVDKPQRKKRFAMGAVLNFLWASWVAGFLLLPLIVMVLKKSQTVNLIVTPVFIILWISQLIIMSVLVPFLSNFARVFGYNIPIDPDQNLSGKDITVATLAYAAVLVVFVGASTQPTTS